MAVLVGDPDRSAIDGVDLRPAARLDVLEHRRLAARGPEELPVEPDPLFGVEMDALECGELARLPCQRVTVAKDGSLFVSDDGSRSVWHVTYTGK